MKGNVGRYAFSCAVLLSAAAACGAGVISGPLPEGVWGGPQGNLDVYADSATLDLPCAAGRISASVVAGSDGTFDLPGFYAVEVGPVAADGPSWQPARFRGRGAGGEIPLTVVWSDSVTVGPLQLHRGTVGTFPRCL